jgi:hypothetical protein
LNSPSRSGECYLCGLALDGADETNRDHVPPRRIFPKRIRTQLKVDMLTLRTHSRCQTMFARDEEYFFYTLLPGGLQSKVGEMLAEDFRHLIAHDKIAAKLSASVRRQFEERPSGLVLPNGLVVQRVQGSRLTRIVWKIIRGLFTFERHQFLPEDKARSIQIIGPFDREVPDYIVPLLNRPRLGHTPECLGYTYADSSEIPAWTGTTLHMWLMVLWERYLLYAAFHDPSCECSRCATDTKDSPAGESMYSARSE